MTFYEKISLFLLRISLGWMFFYSGITKLMDSDWTAAGYLNGAKTFSAFYTWLASSPQIGWVNLTNKWGLTLLGVSLILGFGVRWSAPLGALLMLLYYLPILEFPYPNPHSFLVDEHVIYIFALLVLAATHAGRTWGIDAFWHVREPKQVNY